MKNLILCLVLAALWKPAFAAENLLLVSLDGLRWQEVFGGYDEALLKHKTFTKQPDSLVEQFGGQNPQERRQKLMPFLWQQVARKGTLMGNRVLGSKMNLTNRWWFSYPGYNEILTGRADPRIDSNKAVSNPNVTILEWLNQRESFEGKVAAFGSWDVFPAILNQSRSKLAVNAGFQSADWRPLSIKAHWLNELQQQVPSPWHNVRLDAFTLGFAIEYVTQFQPKVVYLALGETDDFAHDGEYHQYLRAANRADQLLAQFWQFLQQQAQYRDNTNLIITVDHGRGSQPDTWQHHASVRAVKGYLKSLGKFEQGILGADQVWIAAMGPDIKPNGEWREPSQFYLNQVAATALATLNQNPADYHPQAGEPIKELLK